MRDLQQINKPFKPYTLGRLPPNFVSEDELALRDRLLVSLYAAHDVEYRTSTAYVHIEVVRSSPPHRSDHGRQLRGVYSCSFIHVAGVGKQHHRLQGTLASQQRPSGPNVQGCAAKVVPRAE